MQKCPFTRLLACFTPFCAFCVFIAYGLLAPLTAHGVDLTGYGAVEYRQFFHSPSFTHQDGTAAPSFLLEPEVYHTSADRRDSFVFKPFFHYDGVDNKRTHFDLRQADWVRHNNDWEVRAGISRVYWGVAESRHLVDIINQVDGAEDVDDEDRLGQPLIQLATFKNWGALRAFYLPVFRERTYPGANGRLRGPLVVNTKNTQYSTKAKALTPTFALRYEHSLGDWDIGLAQFHGLSREARFIPQGVTATPYYEVINQTSADIQLTKGAWLWKFEGLFRTGQGKAFGATTTGFEYTLFGLFGTDGDLGLLFEYHHDGRSATAPATLFDDDVFFGARYAFNNTADSTLLAGFTTDLKGEGTFAALEASHRLSHNLKIEFDARFFGQTPQGSPFAFLNRDDFAQLRLSYFFN